MGKSIEINVGYKRTVACLRHAGRPDREMGYVHDTDVPFTAIDLEKTKNSGCMIRPRIRPCDSLASRRRRR